MRKFSDTPENEESALIESAKNLVKAINEEWMPDIANRRANETIRQGDLLRCQLAVMLVPLALDKATSEELRASLTQTLDTVKQYQAALQVGVAKAQA